LAEKTGKLLPTDPVAKYETFQWLFWQVGGFGPSMFSFYKTNRIVLGQANHFVLYAKEDVPYAKKRYTDESRRLFGVLDNQLDGKEFIIGNEYTIADISCFGWANLTLSNPKFKEYYRDDEYPNVRRWLKTLNDRPAIQKAQPQKYFQ
jgi:GST-like protein